MKGGILNYKMKEKYSLGKKVLVIDDEKFILRLIEEFIKKEGFIFIPAYSAEEGLKKAKEEMPDIILLDIMLPGINGFEFCRILKKDRSLKGIPIIMLTGKAIETQHKVQGLTDGADDYIIKPFEGRELIARIKAVLRRHQVQQQDVIKKGRIVIDINNFTVSIDKKQVKLRPKEFDLLYLFMTKSGRVLPRSYIFESVWGDEYIEGTRTVDVHIRRLRKKLGPKTAKYIRTVEGKGYIFETP